MMAGFLQPVRKPVPVSPNAVHRIDPKCLLKGDTRPGARKDENRRG